MEITLWCSGSVPPKRKEVTFHALVRQYEGDKWHKTTYSSSSYILVGWALFKAYKKYIKNLLQQLKQNS